MSQKFNEIHPETLNDNVFKLIGKDWMLITAGSLAKYNTMTASWGGMGILWGRKVAFCVIRPQRYTFQFMESAPVFSLTFFTEAYRYALDFIGTNSGRKLDKAAECGLTPFEPSPGIVSFMEARLILECKKLYTHDLDPEKFLDPTLNNVYPARDYHRMYIGEIMRASLAAA